jgi:hypothetical protein
VSLAEDYEMSGQPVSLNTLLVEYQALYGLMLEVLDLRTEVASLETVRSKGQQHCGKAKDISVEPRV